MFTVEQTFKAGQFPVCVLIVLYSDGMWGSGSRPLESDVINLNKICSKITRSMRNMILLPRKNHFLGTQHGVILCVV